MKRAASMLIAMFVLVLMSSVACAEYPTYLGGDKNYILCDADRGTAWYVDRNSLKVQKYDPPQYIIDINVVEVADADKGKTEITKVSTRRFFYNSDLIQMYVDSGDRFQWRYIDPKGSWSESGILLPAGELAFGLAYNMKFYGSAKFYDACKREYYTPFTDAFYSVL